MSIDTKKNFKVARMLMSLVDAWFEPPVEARPLWKKLLAWLLNRICHFAVFIISFISSLNIAWGNDNFIQTSQYVFLLVQQIEIFLKFRMFSRHNKDDLNLMLTKAFTSLKVKNI
jgi:hypothetical protein